jgi:predicted GNAT family acetyltransferase
VYSKKLKEKIVRTEVTLKKKKQGAGHALHADHLKSLERMQRSSV